jgi:nickel/cobalt transporter (NicO) family protein
VASTAVIFATTASATAALHALIPDHWLPFVLLSRSRNWSIAKTLVLASAGGLVHVLLAAGLGWATYALGEGRADAVVHRIGGTMEILSSGGLALFGLLYGTASWYRERRHHPSPGDHAPVPSLSARHHHHGHLLERWFTGDLTGLSLVLIIGVSPCALAFPILLAGAAALGVSGVLLVAAGFGAATMVTTLGVTLFALLSARRLDFPFLTRYGDLISGMLIGGVGAVLCLSQILGG